MVGILLSVILLASCDNMPNKEQRVSSTPATNIAQSPQWADEGARLTSAKQTAESEPIGQTALNINTSAYQSIPIDVIGNGSYTLDFGPVPSNYTISYPAAFAFDFPSDAQFRLTLGKVAVVSKNGSLYLETVVQVQGFVASYTSFTGWIY
jgi:hypothetical protein